MTNDMICEIGISGHCDVFGETHEDNAGGLYLTRDGATWTLGWPDTTATQATTTNTIRPFRADGLCACGYEGETFMVTKRTQHGNCTHFDICLDCALQCQHGH